MNYNQFKIKCFLLWVITILTSGITFSQQSKLSGYKSFPLEGGYKLGALLTIDKKTKKVELIQENNTEENCYTDVLSTEKGIALPSYKLNRKKEVQNEFNGKGKFSFVNVSGDATISELKNVVLTLESGRKEYLTYGNTAINKLFRHFSLSDIEDIKSGADKGIFFVTEIAIYDSASLTFTWNESITTSAQTKIQDGISHEFSASANTKFIDDETLVITFNKGYIAGFKDRKVNKKIIRKSIKMKKKGYNIYYLDKDKDGYGDKNNFEYTNNPKANFVTNCEDCYDKNKDVFPGNQEWYSKHRGDGSFDYNCDNKETLNSTTLGKCGKGIAEPQGWLNKVPSAGQKGDWLYDCDRKILQGGSKKETKEKIQLAH
ncbi:MAG: hypothetical protein N4A45_01990 [Flavobacteriales bacterium]|jgi:hypothetical protein|nr:hypothetical protein [Flavobacteriales bacterium]